LSRKPFKHHAPIEERLQGFICDTGVAPNDGNIGSDRLSVYFADASTDRFSVYLANYIAVVFTDDFADYLTNVSTK